MPRIGSRASFMRQPLVRVPVLGFACLALWLAAELAAFAAVAHMIGFAGAILACTLTSLVGFTSLRRIGLATAFRLRQTLALAKKETWAKKEGERGGLSREALVDGSLAGLGALLLILPGFVSDFVGLALAAPSFRLWAAKKLSLGRFARLEIRRTQPALIDLTPDEWSRGGPKPLS